MNYSHESDFDAPHWNERKLISANLPKHANGKNDITRTPPMRALTCITITKVYSKLLFCFNLTYSG